MNMDDDDMTAGGDGGADGAATPGPEGPADGGGDGGADGGGDGGADGGAGGDGGADGGAGGTVVLVVEPATVVLTAAPSPVPKVRPTAERGLRLQPDRGAVGAAALARCVACAADVFARDNWGRAPRLTRAAELAAPFDDLLDAAAVDELVSARGLRTPFLRMAKDGEVLPTGRFTRSGGAGATIADQVADDRVLTEMADGSTLVLQALHRSWPPLVDFGSRLSDELGHPVQINAYITPSQNQGFAPHYDVHDVFVLQVAGRKRWTIHDPVVPDPLDNQPWDQHRAAVTARVAEVPVIDTVLEPGDALYLPRGTIHAAQAQGETSIHLTVGVHPVTRYQLAKHLLDAAQDDPRLRASLPMGVDLSDPDVLARHLADTIAALHDDLDVVPATRIAREVGTNLMRRTRPEPIGPLQQLVAADTVTSTTSVRLRAGLRPRLDERAGTARLVLLDTSVDLAGVPADAIKLVLTGTVFAPAALTGLAAADQISLVARLLRVGVLVPA